MPAGNVNARATAPTDHPSVSGVDDDRPGATAEQHVRRARRRPAHAAASSFASAAAAASASGRRCTSVIASAGRTMAAPDVQRTDCGSTRRELDHHAIAQAREPGHETGDGSDARREAHVDQRTGRSRRLHQPQDVARERLDGVDELRARQPDAVGRGSRIRSRLSFHRPGQALAARSAAGRAGVARSPPGAADRSASRARTSSRCVAAIGLPECELARHRAAARSASGAACRRRATSRAASPSPGAAAGRGAACTAPARPSSTRREPGIHQAAHDDAALVRDADQQPELLARVAGRHGEQQLVPSPARLRRLQHRGQVRMREIGGRRDAAGRPGQRIEAERLPEAVLRVQRRDAIASHRLGAHVDAAFVQHREPGTLVADEHGHAVRAHRARAAVRRRSVRPRAGSWRRPLTAPSSGARRSRRGTPRCRAPRAPGAAGSGAA